MLKEGASRFAKGARHLVTRAKLRKASRRSDTWKKAVLPTSGYKSLGKVLSPSRIGHVLYRGCSSPIGPHVGACSNHHAFPPHKAGHLPPPMDSKLCKHERTTYATMRQGDGLSQVIHLPHGGCWTTATRSPRTITADSSAFHCSLFWATSCSRPCAVHTARNGSSHRLLAAPRNPRPKRCLDGSLCLQCNARTVSLYEASRHARARATHCVGSQAARRAAWPAHRHHVDSNAASHRGTLASCITRSDHRALRRRYSCTVSCPLGQGPSARRHMRNCIVRTSHNSLRFQQCRPVDQLSSGQIATWSMRSVAAAYHRTLSRTLARGKTPANPCGVRCSTRRSIACRSAPRQVYPRGSCNRFGRCARPCGASKGPERRAARLRRGQAESRQICETRPHAPRWRQWPAPTPQARSTPWPAVGAPAPAEVSPPEHHHRPRARA